MSSGLGGGREDAVEAEVHGLGGVVIGPRAGEHQHHAGAGNIAAVKERNLIGEVGVIHFGEGGGAKVEGAFHRGDEFVFGIGFGELGSFGRGDAGNF